MKPDEIAKLTKFLRGKFELPSISVRRRPQRTDVAEVYIGDRQVGLINRDEEEGELSYHFSMDIDETPPEIARLAPVLHTLFGLETISIKAHGRKTDSAEVYIGDEFIGLLFREDEGDRPSYNFTMTILDFDLE